MNKRIVPAIATCLLAATMAAAAVPGTIRRLSNGTATDQQNQPAISGNRVVWTNASTPSGTSQTNFDIVLFDLTTGQSTNLTNTAAAQEFLEDIDAGNVVWTRTAAGVSGDIDVYNLASNTLSTIAGSTSSVFFQQPSISGRYVTFLRTGTQTDVMLYDVLTGANGLITNDAAVQAHPRVSGDFVVYEDYSSGNADVYGYKISTGGPPFPIATGPSDQVTPDVDGSTVVYVGHVGGSEQIFSYDLTTGQTKQLTTVASSKVLPRISGHRVVWSDDRNGNLDLYLYDLSSNTEDQLVGGAGDQFLADIDGDRVVYTDNASGFEQVFLFTFNKPNQPPVCTAARAIPDLLWPPNHKLVPVTIAGVTDPENDPVTITITGVTQDEPVRGLGDGDLSPDAFLDGSRALIRAERSGTGNGRVYQIHFRADALGGSCTGTATVAVPHSQSQTAIDDGQLYDSTQK